MLILLIMLISLIMLILLIMLISLIMLILLNKHEIRADARCQRNGSRSEDFGRPLTSL